MKEIVFILSSLNDPHYRKRVEEFMDHGYEVTVYGFKREGRELPPSRYNPIVLGEIQNRSFSSRIGILNSSIRSISAQCRGKICFYSSPYRIVSRCFYVNIVVAVRRGSC